MLAGRAHQLCVCLLVLFASSAVADVVAEFLDLDPHADITQVAEPALPAALLGKDEVALDDPVSAIEERQGDGVADPAP